MRYARRVDANHAELAEAFRVLGCSFLSLAPLGKGAPDGAVGYGGLTILVEFKDGAKPKSKQQLNEKQREFWDTWKGGVRVVADLGAVEETVRLLRSWHRKLCEREPFATQPNPEVLREMASGTARCAWPTCGCPGGRYEKCPVES